MNQSTRIFRHPRRTLASITTATAGSVLASLALLSGGCDNSTGARPIAANTSASAEFVDTDFGFRAMQPANWRSARAEEFAIPGSIVKAWMSNTGSNIVAFLQEAGQPLTAEQLLASSAAAIRQMGGTVTFEEVTKIGATNAMSLKVRVPGTGSAVMPGGSVPTFQHWIAIPKQNRVLVLLATAPEASKSDTVTAFDAMIASVKLD